MHTRISKIKAGAFYVSQSTNVFSIENYKSSSRFTKLPFVCSFKSNPMASSEENGNGRLLKGKELRIPVPWGFIAGKSWGDPLGTPVLGLHGWSDNCGTFDKLAPLLSPSLYFVTIDFHGHGFSSHLPAGVPYHYIDSMLILRRVINHLGWTKYSIVGHSMGAGLGSFLASMYPSEVENLIMIDMAKPVTGDLVNAAVNISSALNTFLTREEANRYDPPTYSYFEALEHMRKATENAVSLDTAKVLMTRGARQVDEDEYCFTADRRLGCLALYRFSDEDVFDILQQIHCRLMFIKAKHGPIFESQHLIDRALKIYQENCVEFKQVVLNGNHFIHLNSPKEVVKHINEFFQQH